MDLELHGAKTGNCLRAAIGLAEAGLPFRIRSVDLRGGALRSPTHLELNPAGKVPVLVVRSARDEAPLSVITQSNAILLYAADRAADRLLPREGTVERIKALEAFFYFTSDVIALNGIAFNLQSRSHPDAAALLTEQCVAAAAGSERFLSKSGFMGSDGFSIADIVGFTIVTAMADQLPWDRLQSLADWREKIGRRPAVQAGMRAFDRS